jgi:hypothetical protein
MIDRQTRGEREDQQSEQGWGKEERVHRQLLAEALGHCHSGGVDGC